MLLPLVVSILSGCVAMWPNERDPNARRYDKVRQGFTSSVQKTLLVDVYRQANRSPCRHTNRFEDQLQRQLRDSRLFAEVTTAARRPDLKLVIRVKEKQEDRIDALALACICTLGVIPSFMQSTVDVEGTVYNAEGVEIGKVKARAEEESMIGWLAVPVFIPAMIGNGWLEEDLCRGVMVQLMENPAVWEPRA